MTELIRQIVLVNAYWFSLPFIGLFLIQFVRNYVRIGLWPQYAGVVDRQHLGVKVVLGFAVSVFLFSVISFVLYLLNGPVIILTAIYVLFLSLSVGYAGLCVARRLFSPSNVDIFGTAGRPLITKLLLALFILVIFFDFFISLDIKSYVFVSADSYVHLSRVVSVLSQGFTVDSGYFGGLPEVGYHYNVVYALYATASQVTRLQPFEVWEYSFGFFRFIQWMTILTFAGFVLKHWLKWGKFVFEGSILTTLLAIVVFSPLFFTAVYPNAVVNVWLILLVMGLSMYESGRVGLKWPIFGLAIICTMTHPTYAFMGALFMGMFFVVKTIFEKTKNIKDKSDVIFYGVTILLLMSAPVRTLLFPSQLNSAQEDIGSFATFKIFGLTMKQPVDIMPTGLLSTLLYVVGLAGAGYLLYKLWSRKKQLLFAVTIILFYPVIVYVPGVFTIFHAVLPMWVIDRFSSMNIIRYVEVFIGIYAICILVGYVFRRYGVRSVRRFKSHQVLYITMLIATMMIVFYRMPSSYQQLRQSKAENDHYYSFMSTTHANFKDVLNGEKTIIATQGDSYFIGALLPVNVMAIEAGHMSPAASVDNRISCQSHILNTFAYADLRFVRASYVVLAKYDKDYISRRKIADEKSYLKYVKQDTNFYVYSVRNAPEIGSRDVYESCSTYERVEKR